MNDNKAAMLSASQQDLIEFHSKVIQALNRIAPDWLHGNGTVADCAARTIDELPSYELAKRVALTLNEVTPAWHQHEGTPGERADRVIRRLVELASENSNKAPIGPDPYRIGQVYADLVEAMRTLTLAAGPEVTLAILGKFGAHNINRLAFADMKLALAMLNSEMYQRGILVPDGTRGQPTSGPEQVTADPVADIAQTGTTEPPAVSIAVSSPGVSGGSGGGVSSPGVSGGSGGGVNAAGSFYGSAGGSGNRHSAGATTKSVPWHIGPAADPLPQASPGPDGHQSFADFVKGKVELIASDLGLDPVELRRSNFERQLEAEAAHASLGEEWCGPDEPRRVVRNRKHGHYFRDCPYYEIDIYRFILMFEINDPCLQHALKKITLPGNRGEKDRRRDIQEAIDTLTRWMEMRDEDHLHNGIPDF